MQTDTPSPKDLRPAFSGMRLARSDDPTVRCADLPPPGECAYCGKVLYWIAPCVDNVVKTWWQLELCDCPEAVAEHERVQAEAEAAIEREKQEADRARKRERIDRLIGRSGLGRRFQQRTFENFECSTPEQQKCFNLAKRYADTFADRLQDGKGLLMIGSIGAGKTHLAAAIANQLLAAGIPVIFKTAIDLLSDIRSTYDTETQESKVVDTYGTVELLILDDLGKEKVTAWAASMIFSIINARYENMLPTIITTNHGCKELAAALGDDRTRAEAIVSRLQETCVTVVMAWDDHRKR
jgi:DNA replication protein DnaC